MARKTDADMLYDAKKFLIEKGYNILENTKYKCNRCGKERSLKQNHFYMTNNPMYAGCEVDYIDSNGKEQKHAILPFCKTCIQEMYEDFMISTKKNEKLSLYKLTQELRIPWSEGAWGMTQSSKTVNWKVYIGKTNSLPQYSSLTMRDSDEYIGEIVEDEVSDSIEVKQKKISKSKMKELISTFGDGYTDKQYSEFDKKYNLLKENYTETTAMHTEALIRYIKYSVLEDMAMIEGDSKQAKEWGGMASDSAKAAKINPNQLSKADLMDGLNSFSELSVAVEKAVDVVRILPRFKYRPSDALDFNIWCYVNYERNLNGLPEVEYEEIYKFYDEKVQEYVSQYGDPTGIFTEDPTKENRNIIKKFIEPFREGDE